MIWNRCSQIIAAQLSRIASGIKRAGRKTPKIISLSGTSVYCVAQSHSACESKTCNCWCHLSKVQSRAKLR